MKKIILASNNKHKIEEIQAILTDLDFEVKSLKEDDIKEIIKTLDEPKKDWAKSVIRIQYDGYPVTLDIRKVNVNTKIIGSGISLNDENVDELVNILLEEGYGSSESIKQAYRKRFMIGDDEDE